jgi:hypothetical protein
VSFHKVLFQFFKDLFKKESEEELFEMGVVTPDMARDPITETRLKALVPENEEAKKRLAEIEEALASADEAGVVRKQ